ncbi:nucleoside triphosphate pyrophosphohydrolase [Spongiibacter sp.]|mgnify:FL=1|uniref:nucleoside triphosphate pyrophosphohydrolase n=3 Tax=Spongiibacter TaxID=630749 RepID=UPI000C08EC52|nr:nucleoside triphosphate pyrophosphohydrolase [Spongiibacter sp.]MAK43048.1 nucleoside triphosphate pyrophosphohydrolase [Spongiibacter sp.]
MAAKQYSIDDLRELMSRLRDPQDGCPWDQKQDFKSIVPHTLEEVYELVDAIESADPDQIRQEMGDVLFQLIFYSQLAQEQGDFTFNDVVDDITRKLLRRHPHVFPDGTLESRRGEAPPDEPAIKQRWEEIKAEERRGKAQLSALDDIPLALPATNRAEKLQKRASRLGFDWDDVAGVLAALEDELAELKEAIDGGQREEIADELGDVFFSVVNLSRHLKHDAEGALRAAGQKFERRFRYVEQQAGGQEGTAATPRAVLEQYWQDAKQAGL